jgi:hypothetical protein
VAQSELPTASSASAQALGEGYSQTGRLRKCPHPSS